MAWTKRQETTACGSRRRGRHGSGSGAGAAAGNPGPELYSSHLFSRYLRFNLRQRAGDYGTVTAQGSSIASRERRDAPSTKTKLLRLFSSKEEVRLSTKTVIKTNPKLM